MNGNTGRFWSSTDDERAAHVAGVDRIFKLGGAQAVAALAYGTETVPKVDKITGPGNIFVATAKRLVFGTVDIDMIAGPSEILVINDGSIYVVVDSVIIAPKGTFVRDLAFVEQAIKRCEGLDGYLGLLSTTM